MLNLTDLQPGKYYWVVLTSTPDAEPSLAFVYGKFPQLDCKVLDSRQWTPRFDDYHWLAEFDIEGARQVLGPQHATGYMGTMRVESATYPK